MIGVKYVHRGLEVRLDEVRSSDRGFRVDQGSVGYDNIYSFYIG